MGAELDKERDYDVDVKLKITFKNGEFICCSQKLKMVLWNF